MIHKFFDLFYWFSVGVPSFKKYGPVNLNSQVAKSLRNWSGNERITPAVYTSKSTASFIPETPQPTRKQEVQNLYRQTRNTKKGSVI